LAWQNTSTPVQTLQGAGASFPAPIYQHWFSDLATNKAIQVNYQSVGSSAGIRQLIADTVDFAASDTPVSSNDRQAIKRGVVEIPLTAGAIAIAYNLPGCQLKLSQGQLAGIFLGTIKNYKDLGCSDQTITVVHRSDGSGTTYILSDAAQAQAPGLGYISLPQPVLKQARQALTTIQP
jgi:phosphate transport system substrate-binding protein